MKAIIGLIIIAFLVVIGVRVFLASTVVSQPESFNSSSEASSSNSTQTTSPALTSSQTTITASTSLNASSQPSESSTFKGPQSAPHIKGPSGPPPNY